MQSLEVISVNVWQILISLSNLIILFLVAKRFLFKPVENMLARRKTELDKKYMDAENYKSLAEENHKRWEEKIHALEADGDKIIKTAIDEAKKKTEKLIEEATRKAESIVAEAKQRAENEMKKAEDEIKEQIVDVSLVLAERILMREISRKDNSMIINSFIEGLDHDGNS